MIEAVRGDSWLGDIAIDDITLNEGECRKWLFVALIKCILYLAVVVGYEIAVNLLFFV